ncbi:helix-turn-helix domain-containing protein [Streptomyces hebeiensis]
MPGGRLTQQDRRRIAAGLADGLPYAEIARRLDRPTSTISRERSDATAAPAAMGPGRRTWRRSGGHGVAHRRPRTRPDHRVARRERRSSRRGPNGAAEDDSACARRPVAARGRHGAPRPS